MGVQIGLSLWLALPGQAAERKVLRGEAPAVGVRLQPISSLPDSTRLKLAISLPLRNQAALARLLQQIYDPKSPNFHRYLTPAEFAGQFGPTKEDYQALIDFAGANHLKVTHTHPNRTLLDVSASVAEIRRVLHVNMKVYAHPTEGRTFYAPDADPSVEVGFPVLGIKGLDNFNVPRATSKKAPIAPNGGIHPLGGSGPGGGYIGNDFRVAYTPGVTLSGGGQAAALVEFDGYYPGDIAAYESQAHLPSVTLTNVLIDGFGGFPSFQNGEVALDIEMLVSMAPGLSKILVYEANVFAPVDDLLNRIATDDAASQISCSWRFVAVDAQTDQIFLQYAAQGQSFFCASGDFGGDPPGDVYLPMGNPNITVVGGTQLSTTSAGAWSSETAWSGSSGGFSTNFAIPFWQAGINMATNHGSAAFRNIPDVAMCATNVFVIADDGTYESFSGTSAAAPLWAGFTALVNQQAALYGNGPVGFLNPALYAIGAGAGYATNFYDIITGNTTNSSNPTNYFAVAGYDLCTGWGTPNGSNLINTLAPPDTLVMLPIAGFVSSGPGGGPFSVTSGSYSLTNAGSAALNWFLGSDASWLSVAPSNGTLNPGGAVSVVVNLNSTASNLLAGNYTAHLTVTNLSDGLTHSRSFNLRISDPLILSPPAGITFGGPPGGPFNEAAQICELTNAGQSSVNWSVTGGPAWLTISPSSGTLAAYGSADVSCGLNATATNLPSGVYSAGVLFSNLSYGAQENLPALFMVGQLVQNGGFETDSLADWTLAGFTSYVTATTYPTCVHSGTYGLVLDTADATPGYLSQTIPTLPGQLYSVSLWLDSPAGAVPNWFMLSWGGKVVFDQNNLPAIGWTNLQFTLAASNSSTVFSIGFADSAGYLGLDDVSVTAAPPTIGNVTPACGPVAGGTLVTIAGTGFQSHATVAFGSASAVAVNFNSAINLAALTPASAIGVVNVTITNADGQTAVLTNAFRFIGTPVIAWANPQTLTYGNALGAGQLNAAADVPGTFAYNPSAGAVLDSGSNVLSAVFTPNDAVDYYSTTDYVVLVVGQAPLAVTAHDATRPYGLANPAFTGVLAGWQNGDNITAGYSCGATSASPAGTFPIVPNLVDPNHRLTNYQVSVSNGVLTILPPVPPVFQTVTQSNNTVTLVWAAMVGAAYQVQRNSDLATTNWSNFGNPILATNAATLVTDSIAGSQRYYRVLLVPQ